MEHSQALRIAQDLLGAMKASCEQIEIAGSIRRGKPDPGDIEIVAAPILKPPRPVFGERKTFLTQLDRVLWQLEVTRVLEKIKGGEKYKQYWVLERGAHIIKLDLFLVTPPAQWGVIQLIRTGPEDFSKWMVTPRSKGGALPDGFIVKDGSVWPVLQPAGPEQDFALVDSYPVPMPSEGDWFTLCGLQWIEPKERRPQWRR